ncbi:hydroxymethylglutaryl-CoA reductase [Mytilinidion resinicola]|uniref:hydroxymethylglutaryl-CoA reductase (NADPH) n=1 Tax=Mytilinidion resinicola TaxID=574789 RepID=A0A6A6Y7E7_9PEZI|nr:hydroxymethylglutaryl-CoA reductase [Mytilinidion resinicola]KAF2803904.1 hydroxymethylglutaryl-CoA reductase [Mytilinidion resinicola]
MPTPLPTKTNPTPSIAIENQIGFTKVPLGLAGPLTITGRHQRAPVSAPLATLEATLVASCSRGCKALQLCGGVKAAALAEGMSRAPVFFFGTVDDAVAFYERVPELEGQFRETAEKTSRFCKLVKIVPHIIGKAVHVKMIYTTGDACGQNMTTIATHTACKAFLKSEGAKEAKVIGYQLEGHFAPDKKMAWGNVHELGRGVKVMAWATLTNEVCKKVLKCSTAALHRTMDIARDGMIRNGGMGNSINTANVMAAMFIACGQDVASVLEGGFSHLSHEIDPETQDLTVSMYFPCMVVGTMGGGTGYESQKETLEIIGCFGPGKKFALAETVAAFCLALDLSTASAFADDTFSQSHQRLARGGKSRL